MDKKIQRFAALDGWRGLCATMVALIHLEAAGHFYTFSLVRHSYLFVDFFFVLSGFVICHAYGNTIKDGRSFLGFIWLRIGRLWPLHITILALLVGMEFAKWIVTHNSSVGGVTESFRVTSSANPYAILTNLGFLHAFGIHGRLTWNFPSWSIAVEFWTYIFFGLCCLFGQRLKWACLGLLSLLSAGVLAIYSTKHHINVTQDLGIFRCLYGFGVGALAWKWVTERNLGAQWPFQTLIEIGCVAGAAAFVIVAGEGGLSLSAPLVFAVVVIVFRNQQGLISKLLLTTPCQLLGKWSYSIYMVHALVLDVMMRGAKAAQHLIGKKLFQPGIGESASREILGWGSPWQVDLLAVVYLLVVILVSACTYKLIEEPGRRWFRRRLDDRERVPATDLRVTAAD